MFWLIGFAIGRSRHVSTGSRSISSSLKEQTRMNNSISDVLRVFRLCCDELGTTFSLEFSRIHQTVIQCLLCSDTVGVDVVIDG